MPTKHKSAADEILRRLFTNGAGQEADRLLLIKDELHPLQVSVNNAQYLGGYSKDAVWSILQGAISPSNPDQLAKLRKAGALALRCLEGTADQSIDQVKAALRWALKK